MYKTLTAIRHYSRYALIGTSMLFATACTQTDTVEPPLDEPEGNTVTLGLSVRNLSTRTHLDPDASGTLIPVYWSDGDRISVNGSASDPLAVATGEKRTAAEFTVRNVEAPYHILYPEDIYLKAADETGRHILIGIPAEQTYSPTSFGDGSAILYGTVETEGGQVALTNRCGAVRFTLTDDADIPGLLRKIVLRSNAPEAPIAGEFAFDLTDGKLDPIAERGSNEVTLLLPDEGVTLDPATARDFYLTIPAGDYPQGFTITFVGDCGRTMECQWLRAAQGAEPGITVHAGRIVRFASMNFDAKRRITSEEDWNEFALAVNTSENDDWMEEWADRNGTVKLAADISATELTCITKEWTGTFDGDGHTITRTQAALPLFATVCGTIRNLTLAGKMTPSSLSVSGSVALASVLEGGTLENCINKMNIVHEGAMHAAMAGLVRSFKGGAIRKCVNEGDLTLIVDCSSDSYNAYAGGIAATIHDLSSKAEIEDCTNKGKISIRTDMGSDNNNGLNFAGFGGIAGWLADGDADRFARFSHCTNSGTIIYEHGSSAKAPSKTLCCGGILGLGAPATSTSAISNPLTSTCYYAEFDTCSNEGAILNGGISASSSGAPLNKIYSGGIAGAVFGLPDKHSLIRNCINTGSVQPHEGKYSRAAFSGVCAGLIGLGGYVSIEDCEVRATIGTTKAMAYAVGGGAGIMLTTFSMTGCRIQADLQFIQAQGSGSAKTLNHYALGAATNSELEASSLSLSGSSISGCSFGGSITTSTASGYSATSWSTPQKTGFDTTNFAEWILSPAYTDSEIVCDSNTYWNGL